MNRYLMIPAVAMIALALSSFQANPVQAGGHLHGKLAKFRCPKCDCDCSTCKLKAEVVDVDKKCYEVECKTICIPRIVWPWQKKQSSCRSCTSCDGQGCTNCINNGARVRKIKVLKTKKYKCPECKYTWSADEKKSGCASSCGCGGTNCEAGCCDLGCDADCDEGMFYDVPQPMTLHDQPADLMYEAAEPGLMAPEQYDFAPVQVEMAK